MGVLVARLALSACLLFPAFATEAGPAEQSLITHYYQSILRRPPDSGGLAFWDAETARLRVANQDSKEVFLAMASQFFASPEYVAQGRDDTGFVR